MQTTQAILAVLAIAAGMNVLHAQTAMTDNVKVEATRAELAKIQEDLADPDPLRRIAVIKTVAESHDTVKIDFALKIALGSDDAALRSIALRAYMATKKELGFSVLSPPNIQKRIDAAVNGEPAEIDELIKQYPYLTLTGVQPGLGFGLRNYDMSKTSGTANVNGNDTSFMVVGDRVSGWGDSIFKYRTSCAYDFQVQKVLNGAPLVLKGALACESSGLGANHVTIPRLTITAPMF
jgi:hypothetical protein